MDKALVEELLATIEKDAQGMIRSLDQVRQAAEVGNVLHARYHAALVRFRGNAVEAAAKVLLDALAGRGV